MPAIVLATLNARYAHASLGLRSLLANLPEDLRVQAALREFTIGQARLEICEELLALEPKILGLGVYIWNAEETTELVRVLKRLRPGLCVVLGGPEVSHEWDQQEIVRASDYVITGEGEVSFALLCRQVLEGGPPAEKVIPGVLPEMSTLRLPYDLYDDADLRDRVVYVEASRGCPFKCEFCLSSLDKAVRDVPLEKFLAAMDSLLSRGLKQFKFIDRTFNLKLPTSCAILEFFLSRYRPGLFVHFELIPDRLPAPLRELIAKFPPGSLQFEVGVQTLNDEVSRRISRRQDTQKLTENFQFLRDHTGVHVHADLIVGLPGESLESFAAGFDRLLALQPQEIQVGILKRLRGTPIIRHDAEWQMVYAPHPPYEILQTRDLDFATVQRLRRFAKVWDLVHNSGNFRDACLRILSLRPSPFAAFLAFSDWLQQELGRTHSISLEVLARSVLRYLIASGDSPEAAGGVVLADYHRTAGRRTPEFLKPYSAEQPADERRDAAPALPRRQQRHLS